MVIVVAVLILPFTVSAGGVRPIYRIQGTVLERHGGEYAVIEGQAAPLAGLGGVPAGSLIVVLEPDPKAAPGPGTDYLGYGMPSGRIRGVASNNVELPAFHAVDLFLVQEHRRSLQARVTR